MDVEQKQKEPLVSSLVVSSLAIQPVPKLKLKLVSACSSDLKSGTKSASN